jgi:hypothetical protein
MFFCNPNLIIEKQVRFSPFIRIISNPNILELENYKYLWWTELDKRIAHSMMFREINQLQSIHPSMTLKQAMKLLYQPDNLTRYDPNNFINIQSS